MKIGIELDNKNNKITQFNQQLDITLSKHKAETEQLLVTQFETNGKKLLRTQTENLELRLELSNTNKAIDLRISKLNDKISQLNLHISSLISSEKQFTIDNNNSQLKLETLIHEKNIDLKAKIDRITLQKLLYGNLQKKFRNLNSRLQSVIQFQKTEQQRFNKIIKQQHIEIESITSTLSWKLSSPFRNLERAICANSLKKAKILAKNNSACMSVITQDSATLADNTFTLDKSESVNLKIDTTAEENMQINIPQVSSSRVHTIESLFARNDKDFIDLAYDLLLGRPADPDGRNHYLSRLIDGHSKTQIIFEITNSPEGKQFDSSLPGLMKVVLNHNRENRLLVGWFFRTINKSPRENQTHKRLRALESLVIRAHDKSRLESLDLKNILMKLSESLHSESKRISSLIERHDIENQALTNSISLLTSSLHNASESTQPAQDQVYVPQTTPGQFESCTEPILTVEDLIRNSFLKESNQYSDKKITKTKVITIEQLLNIKLL